MHLFLKVFILVKRSTCFGRSFRPLSEAQNCVYSNGICQTAADTCCFLVKRSTCFGRSFRPSSGAQNCVYSNGICQTAADTCCFLVKRSTCFGWSFRPLSGTQHCVYSNGICQTAAATCCLTYTIVVYAVLISWGWTERPSETCRAFDKNKSFAITGASCWLY